MTASMYTLHSGNFLELVKHNIRLEDEHLRFANINYHDKQGFNALYWAIKTHNQHNLELLVSKGSALTVDAKRTNALFYAVVCNNLDAIKFFIEKGIDVDIADDTRKTLLMHAVHNNRVGICAYLISQGAHLFLLDDMYKMAIDYAKEPKILELLKAD